MIETAEQAANTAQALVALFAKDRALIQQSDIATATSQIVYDALLRQPVTNTRRLRELTGKPLPTLLRALDGLQQLGIIRETTGKERNKVFAYRAYLDILNQGMEPLRR